MAIAGGTDLLRIEPSIEFDSLYAIETQVIP